MKRRCVPLRADHNLLTPDTHTSSGVRLHPDIQVRSDIAASFSEHVSNFSSSKSAVCLTRRHAPQASPTRRLRFEDETETEAESRYLERQRRRVGQRGKAALISKPDLNLYVNGRVEVGSQGQGHVAKQQKGHLRVGGTEQCDTCGIVLGGSVHLHPPVPKERGRSPCRPHLKLRTEPIKETYIGSITPGKISGGGDQVRRGANQVELNRHQVTLPRTMPTTDLPINPYWLSQHTTPICSTLSPAPLVNMSPSIRLNGTKAGQNQRQIQEELQKPAAAKCHQDLRPGTKMEEIRPCVEEGGLDLRKQNASFLTSETKAESRAPPTYDGSSGGLVSQPVRPALHSDDTSVPDQFLRGDESSRLSLRHLFASVKLSRTRTCSLDRLSSRLSPSAHDPGPSCPRKTSSMLKKTLSVQSLTVQGSPLLQLRKSSSVQNCGLVQKKKKDRSSDYKPAVDQLLQRALSLEDVGCPSSVRSVGRVLQVCSDGTFLLEVNRPKSQMYGFIISRGGGRPDSGVYVEDMVDSSTEKLYAGLLAVGDEILEVNGEKVACLSLDQVTKLLTQNSSAVVRVLRHWRMPTC